MKTQKIVLQILTLFLTSSPPRLTPQSVAMRFETLTPDDGLSHVIVRDVLQDRRGFIWFATLAGLDKFDGLAFTRYRNIPYETHSLTNNFITALHENKYGTLWIGTADGLNKMDPYTQTITTYKPADLGSLNILRILADRSAKLWFGTLGTGLIRFDPVSETFAIYMHEADNPFSLSHNIVRSLCQDTNGDLWIGTEGGGLDRIRAASMATKLAIPTGQIQFIHYRHAPQQIHSLSNNFVEVLYVNSKGRLWVGAMGGGLNLLASWERPPKRVRLAQRRYPLCSGISDLTPLIRPPSAATSSLRSWKMAMVFSGWAPSVKA